MMVANTNPIYNLCVINLNNMFIINNLICINLAKAIVVNFKWLALRQVILTTLLELESLLDIFVGMNYPITQKPYMVAG
jgi:hypothetical protein